MSIRCIPLILWMFLLLLGSCNKEEAPTLGGYKPKFVVEGWIEQDDYPYVILTHNAPFFTSLDSAQISELVIRWAKVTVSDGVKSEVLTSRRDNNYFPPFIYRGSELKGEAGKTYTLTIEYAGNTLSATTTIPQKVPLESVSFTPRGEGDKMQLHLSFLDPAGSKNFYKLYTKTSAEKRFIPTLLSNHDDKYFNGQRLNLQVNRGPVNNLTIKNDPYFERGESIFVKFATVPEHGFTFWSELQDELFNSSNPLIGSTGKITSNIQGPGIGIWCGYGSTVYKVTAQP
jgi:hypothetical protein